jgi:hypothetical protein
VCVGRKRFRKKRADVKGLVKSESNLLFLYSFKISVVHVSFSLEVGYFFDHYNYVDVFTTFQYIHQILASVNFGWA